MHELLSKRPERAQLLALLLPEFVADVAGGTAGGGHLERAQRRRYRLRSETRIREEHAHSLESVPAHRFEEPGVRVTHAPLVHAVELMLGAAIPEVTAIKDGVDHARCVTRLDAAHVKCAYLEAVWVRY